MNIFEKIYYFFQGILIKIFPSLGYKGAVDTQIKVYNKLKRKYPKALENDLLNSLIISRIKAPPRVASKKEEYDHYKPLLQNPNKDLELVISNIVYYEFIESRKDKIEKIPYDYKSEVWRFRAESAKYIREKIKENEKNIKLNKSMNDIYIYLKDRKNWKELKDDVLRNISEIFEGDFSSFNDFVVISEHYNSLKENYLKLAETTPEVRDLIPLFAVTLERLGAALVERFSQNNDDNCMIDAKKCYELSIKLNPFLIPSYGALAIVCGNFDNNIDKAIEYCDEGIKAFEKLQNVSEEQLSYFNRPFLSDPSAIEMLIELKSDFLKRK